MALRQATAELCPACTDPRSGTLPRGHDEAVRSVCVIGAGLAGLACALAAAQAGMQVRVVEASKQPVASPLHVNVVPGMLRALASLGLADAATQRGFPYAATDVVDADGRLHFRLAGQRLAGSRHAVMLGIAHTELMAVLRDAVRSAGVDMEQGLGLRVDKDSVERIAADADLVVMATGADAPLASLLLPQAPKAQGTGQWWWRAVVPRPPKMTNALLVVGHAGDRAGAIPMDMSHAGVYLMRRDDGRPLPPAEQRGAALRQALSAYQGPMREMAAWLRDDSPVLVQPVRHAIAKGPRHSGRFLAVGDAAHLLVPQFGQNGTQAFEDAVVLKALLMQALGAQPLCAAFSHRRAARVQAIHDICLQAAHWQRQPGADTDLQALWERLGRLTACEP
jgi:2-polyprenyl-6-methoxyphenol hydroxylase-like FAD-dependent oxidoreductase